LLKVVDGKIKKLISAEVTTQKKNQE